MSMNVLTKNYRGACVLACVCDIPGRWEPAEGSLWVNVFSGNIEASHDSLISAFGLFILSVLPMCCLHNI